MHFSTAVPQVSRLRELYEEHKSQRDCAAVLADAIGAGFSAGAVARQLREHGLVASKKGAKAFNLDALGGADGGELDAEELMARLRVNSIAGVD